MRPFVVAVLALHIAAGTVAIGGGVTALVTTKGGPVHRRSGRVFARSMLAVIASAAVLALASSNVYFAALTVGAAAPAFSGVRVLRRKRPDLDPAQRATALDWTASIAMLSAGAALLVMAWAAPATRNRGLVFALAGAAVAHMLYDLWRFTRPTRWPAGPRVWLFEHIVRMLAAYFAALAAFSGSVLILFDPPWRQLWAVTLGQWLTVVFLIRYRRGLRDADRAPAREVA